MGTRSRIGVMHGDKIKSVYCHWDGYLSHNGKILQEHYDSSKANQLVALGSLISLKENIGEKHPFDTYVKKNKKLSDEENERIAAEIRAAFEAAREKKWSTFYGRDGGEKGEEFKVAHTFAEFLQQCDDCGAEYYYIMKDGVWYCGDTDDHTDLSGALVELSVALAKEKETE